MRSKNPALNDTLEAFVNEFYTQNLRAPSLREIEAGTGISRQTAQRYLRAMSEAGRLSYGEHGPVTEYMASRAEAATRSLPVVGSIVCGGPAGEEEQILGTLDFPVSLLGRGEFFVLRAYGDSMAGAGIEAGDLVIVRRERTAPPGRIVVALDGEGQTTLKRLAYNRALGRYYLHPENESYADIYPAELRIQGVAVKVIKELE